MFSIQQHTRLDISRNTNFWAMCTPIPHINTNALCIHTYAPYTSKTNEMCGKCTYAQQSGSAQLSIFLGRI